MVTVHEADEGDETGTGDGNGEDLSALFERVEGGAPDAPAVRRLARIDPDEASVDEETVGAVLDELDRLLADDRIAVHRLAAAAGVGLVRAAPGTADRWFERLRPLLDDDATERRGLVAVERLARERPDAVAPHADALLDHLGSPRADVRRCAAGIARTLSETRPAALVGSVPDVVAAVGAEDPGLGSDPVDGDHGPGPFGAGGDGRADDRPFLERSRRVEQAVTRATLARVLAAVTRDRPEESADRVIEAGVTDALLALFDDEQPLVRAAAVGLAGPVADRDPAAVGARTPTLLDLLDDDNETVRGGAVWTLVTLGREGALDGHESETIEALGRVARTDGSDRLRELAAAALGELEPELEEP